MIHSHLKILTLVASLPLTLRRKCLDLDALCSKKGHIHYPQHSFTNEAYAKQLPKPPSTTSCTPKHHKLSGPSSCLALGKINAPQIQSRENFVFLVSSLALLLKLCLFGPSSCLDLGKNGYNLDAIWEKLCLSSPSNLPCS